ncbi:MAG: zinc ribbon domain-containing protein [Acutalibacter sp.]|nr:zinc ribbon domain-containing protein [Acutalibacter sp.]
MICPSCKNQIPDTAVACPQCGARFRTKQCQFCNATIVSAAVVCPHCRHRLVQSAVPSTAGQQKKSILLLISAILGILYGVYIVYYVLNAGSAAGSAAEAIGIGIATALITPHMICAVLAAIFNVLGWILSSRGLALTGAILYTVAAVLFPLYALFVLVQIILSFIGFARLKALNS